MNSNDSGLKKISNPPFKSFIDYRIGDYNTFRKVMLELIRKSAFFAGTSLPKSERRDYGTALVDMWAYLCDILTYYQERIASESFIRTARLEESVIELLYLVDHLPHRGRSASTLVRFIADEKKVPPMESGVIIPMGFKIKSVPEKGQEAVVFETNEPLVISSDHNLMKLDGWRTSYKLEQGTTELILDKVYPELNPGDIVMISDDKNFDVVRINKKVDKDGKSKIEWTEDKALQSKYTLSKTKIQKFTQVVRPFGHNAPPSILSNVGVTLFKKKNTDAQRGSNNDDEDDSNKGNKEEREPVARRQVQLVDVSDRVIASASSDSEGRFTFKGLIPGSYRILIARSQSLTDEGQLYPIITTITTNRFQLLPGHESWFEAELEFGGEFVKTFADRLRELSKKLLQENPFAEKGVNVTANNNPFLPSILDTIANDIQSDTRPGLTLIAKETYPFDPVSEDILGSEIYLDKVYENVDKGSFVIISKDDPSNQIDTSRQLFKVSSTGQLFHAKYGIGENVSTISLQTIDEKEDQGMLVFCWEDILEELKREGGGGEGEGNDVPGEETKKLIEFLNEDIHALDPKKDRPLRIENENALQISDQNKKNIYLIHLNEKENGKASLYKNGKKLLDFLVKKKDVQVGEDEEGREGRRGRGAGAVSDFNTKSNLYAPKLESRFYKIRNTSIFTNPVMEIRVDPRYASQDRTDEYADSITLEGMHIGLKPGDFLAVTDNTSIIQGKVVDNDLNPLEGYRVAVYRVKKPEDTSSSSTSSTSASVSLAPAPIEVTAERSNAEGYFSLNDLRADSYLLSLSLPLEKYWRIFVNNVFEDGFKKTQRHEDNDDDDIDDIDDDKHELENENREIVNILLPPKQKEKATSPSAKDRRSKASREKDLNHELTEFAKHQLNAYRELIAIIGRKRNDSRPQNLESRFARHIYDILDAVSEIDRSIKDQVLPLIDSGSDLKSSSLSSSSSSSSSTSFLNKSVADIIKKIENEPEPKLKELKLKCQQVLDRLPNERPSASISFVKDFIQKTTFPIVSVLEEILIIVKESLQSPFRSTIYQNNERLLGVTKTVDLDSDTATNVIMTFNIKDKLTYVESKLQHSKLQVTRIAGSPSFSDGKTYVSLNPALSYPYVKGFAEIYGNMVPASHGETVKDEILGSGDASIIHQEFTLRKGPISYVQSPLSPNGIKSTLKVVVNDIQWQERDDFLDSDSNDQHYVTSLNEDGNMKVTFGDGVRGSTLPTGIDNVHAQYRVGMGFKGNLPPKTDVVPQEKNPAIKSVSIPAGSYGGAEKILRQQKKKYRPHILTLGRAVSLVDYSNLATTFGEISKSRAYLSMKDRRETVVLVVAGHGGRIVSSALQMELQAFMDERRDISIPLQIESYVPVPVDIIVEIKVNDNYLRSKVASNVLSRLGPGTRYDNYNDSSEGNDNHDSNYRNGSNIKLSSGGGDGGTGGSNGYQSYSEYYESSLFSFERLNFGQKVALNDLYAVIENVPGVDFAVIRKFSKRSGRDTSAVQEVISANLNEILQCENDPLDPTRGTIKVVARGGLEL